MNSRKRNSLNANSALKPSFVRVGGEVFEVLGDAASSGRINIRRVSDNVFVQINLVDELLSGTCERMTA